VLLLALPMALVFVIGFAVPLAFVLRFAFDEFDSATGQVDAVSLQQFIAVFTTPLYGELILRTLALSLVTTLICILIGYPLAMAIASGPRWVRPVLLAVVTMPMLTSVVVKTFGWSVLLSGEGVLQGALDAIGLSSVRLLFTPLGVVIGLVHTYLPFMVLSLIAALSAVDKRGPEAARSLGAAPMRVFFGITLPQTWDGLAAGAALTFVTSMSALVTPQLLGGGRVSTIVTVIYAQATSGQNWPLASALGVVLLLVTFIIFSLQAWVVRHVARS
jgi:putative spermidine/putrescine transport system permease protein